MGKFKSESGKRPAKKTFVFKRVFDAPRELVFKAWIEPQRLAQWWGPEGFTNPVCEVDAKPGGAILIHMRGPDGAVYPMTGVFREINAPERLVFASAVPDGKGGNHLEVLNTVTFAEQDGKTTITVQATIIRSTAQGDIFLEGMEEGWTQSLKRLAGYVMGSQKLTPCLWFNDNAEEAVTFYTSIFKNSKIKGVTRYGDAAAEASGRPKGSVMTLVFELEAQEFMALNGGPHFKFTPALSFFVWCETEKEINDLWKKLSEGGKALMELNKYPFAEKYGWCEDKFGVSWQVILSSRKQKISPALLFVKEQSGKAEEAMKFYTSLFENSKIESIARDEKTGVVLHARFALAGQTFVALESPMDHPFTFTPAISFIVNCDNQQEVDEFWKKLSADKEAEQCGWLRDRFAVSWQIVPRALGEMMLNIDSQKSERVMKALLNMKKLDIQTLEQAARK